MKIESMAILTRFSIKALFLLVWKGFEGHSFSGKGLADKLLNTHPILENSIEISFLSLLL